MDDALRLLARARDDVADAERMLAGADDFAWFGPSAAAYRTRLDERRAACAALRLRLDHLHAAAMAAAVSARAGQVAHG